jgi:RNA polymerase sigma factor (sigma-70 family)
VCRGANLTNRPLSQNPKPDAFYGSSARQKILEEIHDLGLRRWIPPCRFNAPPLPRTDGNIQITAVEVEWITREAKKIAYRRGYRGPGKDRFWEFLETVGTEAFEAACAGSPPDDPCFDLRGFALAKSALDMDAKARREQSKRDGRAVSYLKDGERVGASMEDEADARQTGEPVHWHSEKVKLTGAAWKTVSLTGYGESEKHFTLDDVMAALECLSDRQRAIVELMLDGRSQDDMVAELGISQGTISRHYNIAIRLLRQKLSSGE